MRRFALGALMGGGAAIGIVAMAGLFISGHFVSGAITMVVLFSIAIGLWNWSLGR